MKLDDLVSLKSSLGASKLNPTLFIGDVWLEFPFEVEESLSKWFFFFFIKTGILELPTELKDEDEYAFEICPDISLFDSILCRFSALFEEVDRSGIEAADEIDGL